MISSIFRKLSGRHYRKFIKAAEPVVARINELEVDYQKLTDEQLRGKTEEFRGRHRAGESPDALLTEAFAAVKNAARRLCPRPITVTGHEMVWDMIHFDVQLVGGMALHQHMIAEMATGEGKTLVATLPLYLNALTGRNCQLVTTNDFLARRDSEWMGYIYTFLGLTVGCIQNQMSSAERREMYGRDVTYGTASEFGFDYLRDNGMATRKEDQVQRDYYFCIIDEVDSILVDEARTPLIISGPVQTDREMPFPRLKPGVERLVRSQNRLCTRLAIEARKELKNGVTDSWDPYEKLLQAKLGMPKNKQFLRLMETAEYRKSFEKFDLEMTSDFNKEQRYRLKEELFYTIDEKQHQADLTEQGRKHLRPDSDDAFVLPDLPGIFMEIDKDDLLPVQEKERKKAKAQEQFESISEEIHCISQLLRAYSLYEKDIEYVVQNGKVMIVDENTGRIMPGRRWSDGLHQSVEAKEGVVIEKESKTFAKITIQNYFRLYEKLAGMTGTAETEANEFKDIYRLSVMVIPTNRPVQREDDNDLIFKTRREKYNAVIEDIQRAHSEGQPMLVGTTSVDSSEVLSRMLKRVNIPHNVLNAKFHEQEADIIARAGKRGMVTIATNMAGRGTDIKLGESIPEIGGLYVIGTERHQSRRIDRQLRGRCARQGDPGRSRFYLSLEDDLMRLYGQSGMASKILEKSFIEGEALEHKWLNPAIERAQKTVEQHHYSIRKRLLQYDDVLNRQREVIYEIRNGAIHSDEPRKIIFDLVLDEIEFRIEEAGVYETKKPEDSVMDNFLGWANSHFPIALRLEDLSGKSAELLKQLVLERIQAAYATKEAVENPDALRALERYLIIQTIDRHWQDHLTEMEDLHQSVGLRGYGQKDPLNEYKNEAFVYFDDMMQRIQADICSGLFRSASNISAFENMLAILSRSARASGPGTDTGENGAPGGKLSDRIKLPKVTLRRTAPKVGRNVPCPCGSGKKYKKCCGRAA